MDPPHITEFASERYFSKLNQLNGAQQPAPSSSSSVTTTQASPFILPLRESRVGDGDVGVLRPAEHKRSRFFGFRSKVHLLHPKQPAPAPVLETVPIPKPVVDQTPHTRQVFITYPDPRRCGWTCDLTVRADYPLTNSSAPCRTNCRFKSSTPFRSPTF